MISRIAYKVFKKFYTNYENFKKQELNSRFRSEAIIGTSTILGDEFQLFNNLNDPSKVRIGNNALLRCCLLLYAHGGEIEIGDETFIGVNTMVWSAKRIKIGSRVLIAHNVNIHDNNSHPLDSKERHRDYLHIFSKGLQKINNLNEKEVIIEDDVWIGFNSTIFKGVKIGKGAIIGANTVITKDVPPFSVIVGNPPKIIKYTT